MLSDARVLSMPDVSESSTYAGISANQAASRVIVTQAAKRVQWYSVNIHAKRAVKISVNIHVMRIVRQPANWHVIPTAIPYVKEPARPAVR